MCAYNSINGQPACANEFLLQDQLRGKWGFKGYVVSDCGAVLDIYDGHHFKPTQAEASAISLQRGMDNECVDFTVKVNDDHDYKPYLDAVKQGYLQGKRHRHRPHAPLHRAHEARHVRSAGDGPLHQDRREPARQRCPSRHWPAKWPTNPWSCSRTTASCRFETSGIKIAVVGPLADQTKVLLGNYNGIPTHTVSILEGIRKEFAGATINYVAGTQFLSHDAAPVPASALTVDGKPGIKASYARLDMSNVNDPEAIKPVAMRVESTLDAAANGLPADAASVHPLSIRWEGSLTAQETGDYNLGLAANGFFRMKLDGKDVTSAYGGDPREAKLGRVHLEAGKPAALLVEYSPMDSASPIAKLVWSKVDSKPQPAAIDAAKAADVVVAVVGITSELEGEEMQVSEEGFKGGDRTSIDLPKPEQELLEALAATGKPLVVVLTNGSALAVNWAKAHANAILDAWYPGEEGGTAVAETLSGRNNPAGRLPVTFYKGVNQLPPFEDYAMKGRTYRYFEGTPLYPFGYGLSYTTFSYSGLTGPAADVVAGSPAAFEVTVTNTGSTPATKSPSSISNSPKFPARRCAPCAASSASTSNQALRKPFTSSCSPRDLSMVTEAGEPIVADGEYTVSVGGGQPGTGVQVLNTTLTVKGQEVLPE